MTRIERAILQICGQNVMLDRDLAELYGVSTKALKQAVRRNLERFPGDFMFELSKAEFANWRSQFVTSNSDRMGLRHPPMAFTEQGVAMLSSVLRSSQGVKVNIAIMRAFVKLRGILASHADLACKLEELESKDDEQFRIVFDAIRQLMTPPDPPHRKIGSGEIREAPGHYETLRTADSPVENNRIQARINANLEGMGYGE